MNELLELGKAIDISIPLRFNGPQPNAYGVDKAASEPVRAGELVGDTRQGGSVNFERYAFIPHCSGTHTECVGHITHQRISVRECLQDVIVSAVLVTVEPRSSSNLSLEPSETDRIIERDHLESKLRSAISDLRDAALIVRTLPNEGQKLAADYGEGNIPPYFTREAMEYIIDCGFKHLLVDLPSIDRLFDEGKLTNHRIFWNVEPGSFELNANSRVNSTITEMIFVPNDVADGEYLLNLQIPPFETDAAPSRPLLFRTS